MLWHFRSNLDTPIVFNGIGAFRITSSFRSLAYFARVPRPQHNWLIFIGCTIIGLLAILVAMATGLFPHKCPFENAWQLATYCAVLFSLSWAALIANYRNNIREWAKAAIPVGKDDPETHNASAKQQAELVPPRIDIRLMIIGGALFLLVGLILSWIFHWFIIAPLDLSNDVFSFWRSVHPLTGVSAFVPLVILCAGLYGWFWQSLSGLALFNAGRPKLPKVADLPPQMPMFSRAFAGRWIERSAIPLNANYVLHFLLILVPCFAFWHFSGDVTAVRALGSRRFGQFYFFWNGFLIVLTLTEAWHMLRTWAHLRLLLQHLDRLPI
jgi:hypothetical protein